ncbi:TetR family transcriptional regulator [Streptomyces sp. NPDC048279]|jgi:TetR/AcrR family transcriptional repressor of nem operon|uniref:TetR/AcrR family transcriptional regulator n=1 Tax=Streptomyces sp. NPDC048279 TaxID=3154714 RepID=UPI00342261F5
MARTKEFEPEVALRRAVDVFWERGYEKTSMEDLVQRMGIGRRSLYDTFGDKHALFLQALRTYTAQQDAQTAEIAEKAANARQAIRWLLETSLADGSVLRRGCLAVNTSTEAATSDPEASAVLERHFAHGRQLVQGLVERGRRDGTITADHDTATLTATVFNAWLGLRVRVRAGASLDQLAADINAMLALLH